MKSNVRLLINSTGSDVYDKVISDDRTGFSPIEMMLSVVNPSHEIKRVKIEQIEGSFSTAKIDFAGANGKWFVANDINGSAGEFSTTIHINNFPTFFWIKAISTGLVDEVAGEDYSTILRVTSTQTDFFDIIRSLEIVGSTGFDTLRTLQEINGSCNADTLRQLKTPKMNYYFIL
ncbi:MAG: hypothetical protein K0R18_2612 [Bacillales bacterium]|nr:hypothetical protein [Bacillales bacterium]